MVQAELVPALLPARLDLGGLVAVDALARVRSAGLGPVVMAWPSVGRRDGDGCGFGRAASGAGDPAKHERERAAASIVAVCLGSVR